MEPEFDIKQLEYKPVPKKQESTIVKICKKKEVVDEVFPDVERLIEPGPLIVNNLDDKLIDRNDALNRLRKLMNGQAVDDIFGTEEEKEEEDTVEKVEKVEKEDTVEKVEKVEKKKETKEKKTRITKKQQNVQEGIDENMVVFSKEMYKEIQKSKKFKRPDVSSYYMTNRRLFVQKLNGLFQTHAKELSQINDADVSCDKRSTDEFETLTHQKVVRDYINVYSPYRGLLIYHGLGSGKTCTSIAVAEGMKSEKQIIIMTPASLKSNYFSELKKCGDEIYRKNQYWVKTEVKSQTDADKLSKLISLDADYIMENGVWLGNKKAGDNVRNFEELTPVEQNQVDEQLDLMIRKKYDDINYNSSIITKILKEKSNNYTKNPFDNCVVIIDEVHNFVSRIVNKLKNPESASYRLYDYLMSAQNTKLIFLTGTPIINYPNEIAILLNMLRGYIKVWTFQVKQTTANKIDRDAILRFFKKDGFSVYDYVEYSGNKVTITRNPFGFVNVLKKSTTDNPFADYDGVTLDTTGNLSDARFKERVVEILDKNGLEVDRTKIKYDNIKALPDDKDSFISKFIDPETGNMNNSDLLKRRILGLTSYFKSAQEKLLPKYDKDRDFTIIRTEMSNHQLAQYSLARKMEIKEKKRTVKDVFEMTSTYRIYSRELCNFVFPDEYPRPTKKIIMDALCPEGKECAAKNKTAKICPEGKVLNPKTGRCVKTLKNKGKNEEEEEEGKEEEEEEEEDADYLEKIRNSLAFLKENGDQYLSKEGLKTLSPKFLHLLENLEDEDNVGLHLIYSQFRTIEGIGVLKLILEQNGFAEFKLVKKSGEWDIKEYENEEDNNKQKFVLYTGTETAEEKEIIRNIYNSNWKQVSSTIRNKLKLINDNNYMGEIIKVFMITSSGAEGINLENTRFVHISEPYWHPVRIEQVIGRAKRICSHKNLPEELRTIKVFLYLATISKEQLEKNIELKTLDDGKTTDEYLFELANTKERINKQILDAVKETAMDCALYKDAECYDFGKVSSNNFSTVPFLDQDATQKTDLNVKRAKISGEIMEILGKQYIATKTNERNVK